MGALAPLAASGAAANTMGTKPRQSFTSFTLDFNARSIVGPIIAAQYPQIQLLDTITFQRPYELIGFDLNASFFSIENAAGSFASGVFLVVGQTSANLAVSDSVQILGSILCPALALDEVVTPASNPIFFDEDFCYALPAGTPVSMYGCNIAVQTRLQAIAAVANIYLG